ncbi:HAD-IIIA family hydrolase [[Mycoplasma] cavipharyngis]|uniref:YqeG family HAD IIIA-type phosphatase n=1 Tax=[Mycoplasma] cavipharyngis TaxID=92757 RepID=UPI00370390EF
MIKKKLLNYFKNWFDNFSLRKFFLNWFDYFRPNIFVSNLSQINVDWLVGNRIRLVIIDLDNTLVPFFAKRPTSYALKFIRKLKSKNMIVIVASNNRKKRVVNFCRDVNDIDDYIWLANKPFSWKIRNLLKKYHIVSEQTVIIGDQFITDIWTANILGTKSILVTSLFDLPVNQITKKNSFKYWIENYIYWYLQKKNIVNENDLSKIIIGTNDEIF